MAKVKKDSIGKTIFIKKMGHTTITEKSGRLLLNAGRFEHLEGSKKPVPLQPKSESLEDKTLQELRELAQDLEGYKKNLKKSDLIELLNASIK